MTAEAIPESVADKVCLRLQRLREGQVLNVLARKSDKEFYELTKVHTATAAKIRSEAEAPTGYLPDTDLIERWVRGCGSTLWEFFKDIEGGGKKKHMRVVPGYEHFYKLLTQIIDAGGFWACESSLISAAMASGIPVPESLRKAVAGKRSPNPSG